MLFLLIVIPALEIGVFIYSGNLIGIIPTVALIIITGVIGIYLARREGFETLRRVQRDLYDGRVPQDAFLDGICIFIGGILLFFPGFITDIVGIFLLLPFTREFFKKIIRKNILRWYEKGSFTIIR